jgi:hypothetical protein
MSKLNSTIDRDIVVELTETNYLAHWPCDVCNGRTDKVDILLRL